MEMMEPHKPEDLFWEIMASNKGQQARARELNCRAGEDQFPVLEAEELEKWVTERLAGARSIQEVRNLEALRLAPLDEKRAQRIVEHNPDTIEIFGKSFQVIYRTLQAPLVELPRSVIPELSKLPDDGIFLPSDRQVELQVSTGDWTQVRNTDIRLLKQQASQHLASSAWIRWLAKSPQLEVPDLHSEPLNLPEVQQVEYGRCAISEAPLIAYGTLAPNPHVSSRIEPWLVTSWHKHHEDAAKARAAAIEHIAQMRCLDSCRRKVEKECEDLLKRVRALLFDHHSHLSSELINRLQQVQSSPNTMEEVICWKEKIETVISEAVAFVNEQRRHKQQEARKMAEEEARRAQLVGILLKLLQNHWATCHSCGKSITWTSQEAEWALKQSWSDLGVCHCRGNIADNQAWKPILDGIECGARAEGEMRLLEYTKIMRRTTIAGKSAIELILDNEHGRWRLGIRLDPRALDADGNVITTDLCEQPSMIDLKIAELKRLAKAYPEELQAAERDAASGYLRRLSFRKVVSPATKSEQWVCGGSKSQIRYIVCEGSKTEIKEGPSYYCREGQTIAALPQVKIIEVEPFLQIGRDFKLEIAELQASHAKEPAKNHDTPRQSEGIHHSGADVIAPPSPIPLSAHTQTASGTKPSLDLSALKGAFGGRITTKSNSRK